MPDTLIWPLVAMVIAIAALLILRPALLRLVDRTSKVGKEGLTFERPQEGGKPETPLLSFDELMKLPVTATVLDREKTTEATFQSFKLKDEKEKITVLIRALVTTQINLEFNNISTTIFGTQLNLLLHLSSTTQGINLIQAETMFIQAQEKYQATHANRSFDDWLNYLLIHNLIIKSADKIDITQYGSDFLKYLVDARQVYERHG